VEGMRIPFRLLFAFALFYCSMSALNWAICLHTDPWTAADFAAEQAAAKGFDWPEDAFYDLGGGHYRVRFVAPDNRSVTVEVSKGTEGWRLVSLTQGKALWRNVAASR
jgi:hypothetical protein